MTRFYIFFKSVDFALYQEVQLLFIFYISLQILSSISIFALLSPDSHFNLISNLSNFESENSIGWKRSSNFISLHLVYRKCNKNTKLRSFLSYLHVKYNFFKKRSKSARKTHFFRKCQNSSI